MINKIKKFLPQVLASIVVLGLTLTMSTQVLAQERLTTLSIKEQSKVETTAETAYKKTLNGNVYMAGKDFTINDAVSGDLLTAGEKIIVKSQVNGNVMAAGGQLQLDGKVMGDILVAGGVVIINGEVKGDLRVFAGDVYINSTNVSGDLFAYAGQIHISDKTKIAGDVVANEGTDNDTKTVFLNETNNPTTLDDSRIPNNYYNVAAFKESLRSANFEPAKAFFRATNAILSLVWTIGGLLAAFVIIKLFPVFFNNTLKTMEEKNWTAVVAGFLVFIFGALVGLILLVSVIGIPLLGALITLSIIATMLANIYARYMVGKWIMGMVSKDKPASQFVTLAVGYLLVAFVLYILKLVPILGTMTAGTISTILFWWALGAMVINKREMLSNKK